MNIKSIIKEEIDNQILTEVENELRELLSEQYNNEIIAYHGTRYGFDTFEPFHPKGAIGNPKGIYFTRDLQTATEYAQDVDGALDDKSRVVKAKLTIDSDADGKIINHSYRGEEIIMFNSDKIQILDDNVLIKNNKTTNQFEQYNTPDDSTTSNLPYFGSPINISEDLLNERDDMPKIQAAQKIQREIEQKIKNNDFTHKSRKADSPIDANMVGVEVIYKDITLEVNFTDLVNQRLDGGYGNRGGIPMITIFNCVVEIGYDKVNVSYKNMVLYHEIIHFLDKMISKHNPATYDIETMEMGDSEKQSQYYNSTNEMNAITLQIFRLFLRELRGNFDYLPTNFNEFLGSFFNVHKQFEGGIHPKVFYGKLTPENKKRFLKRTYAFFTSLLEVKKKKEKEMLEKEQTRLTEVEDYHMDHRAPNRDDAPMYDLTDTYPDDIYGDKAVRYYGDGAPYDTYSIRIMQMAKGKPNMRVKIYRAVPKILTNQEKIDNYINQKKYILKYGRIPKEVTNWGNKSEYYNYISDEIEKLKQLGSAGDEEKIKINLGDWVTINPAYAKEHGQGNLNNKYKVLSKTVTAKELFTDGGSIHEWGYNLPKQSLNEELITLYRGIGYNEGNNYYSPSKEFAMEFTRSGRESELRIIKVDTNRIYKHNPLPRGYGSEDPNFDLAIKIAQEQGYNAMWVDEGNGQPNSVFVINPKNRINEDLNEVGERTQYDGYTVGDVITSDGDEPYTGDNVFPIKGQKYQLIQKPLSDFKNYTRQDLYDNDKGYEKEQDVWLDNIKRDFDKLPPIPEEDDGLHRIIAAKELGHNTILMWKRINTLNEDVLNENTYKVYHGTNEKFSKFDFKNSTQGIVWFTDSIDSIRNQEHGGQGSKYIMTRYITINKPAGWDEYEKYGLGQLESMGYDGVILPQGDKTDYFVFSPKSISAKQL